MGLYPSASVFPEDPAGTGMQLRFTANDPGLTAYDVLAGDGADAWRLIAANWGNAAWDTQYTGPRGTLGALPSSAAPQNRVVQLGFRLLSGSLAAAPGHLSDMQEIVDLMRKYGGRVTVRHASGGYRQHLEVFAGAGRLGDWTNRAELYGRYEVGVELVCGPYVLGDTMHVIDRFVSDTESDYTLDSGSAGNVTVGAGQFKSTATGSDHVAVHTDVGYLYGDHQATVRVVPTTVTNHRGGVVVKRTAAGGNYLRVYVVDNGATSTLTLEEVRSGTPTSLATQALAARITSGVPYWVVGRVEGNTVYAEHWTTPPTLGGTATTATSAVLTGTPKSTFGEGTTGQAGVYLRPASASDYIEFFEARPFVYRGSNFTGRGSTDRYRLDGAVPGDAPALSVVELASSGTSGDNTRFGMLAWSRAPGVFNMIPDGGFSTSADGFAAQWSVAAVSGVTGAATSITSVSSLPRFGSLAAQVVCPATANTGASCVMYRVFRAGVTYTAQCWVKASSGTTNTRIRLGVSGDIASETASALTAGWVKRTVTWTPTATVTAAYFAVEITAATATTFQLDGVSVYEGTTEPVLPSQTQGNGGVPPWGVLDAGERVAASAFTLTTGASTTTYRNGRYLGGSGSSGGWIQFLIDTALIPIDDLSQGLDVEVWMLAEAVPSASVWTASVSSFNSFASGPPSVGSTYTREHGSTGKTITTGGVSGLVRLGTIPLAPDTPGNVNTLGEPSSLASLYIQVATGVSIASTRITSVLLIPSRSRALSPTGKSNTNYPYLDGGIGSVAFTRRFDPDLRGYDLKKFWRQASGLGGSMIELEPGPTEFATTVSRHVPDISGATTTLVQVGALAVTPTPRWHHIRDE